MTAPRNSGDGDEKWNAYGCTILEFPGPPPLRIDLRQRISDDHRRHLAQLGLDGPFAVLTAENPRGANPEDASSDGAARKREERNDHRATALDRGLERAGVPYAPVDGVAPDGNYRERCVAAMLSREEAEGLARRLEQLALFWFDGAAFWLLPAKVEERPERLPRAGEA